MSRSIISLVLVQSCVACGPWLICTQHVRGSISCFQIFAAGIHNVIISKKEYCLILCECEGG